MSHGPESENTSCGTTCHQVSSALDGDPKANLIHSRKIHVAVMFVTDPLAVRALGVLYDFVNASADGLSTLSVLSNDKSKIRDNMPAPAISITDGVISLLRFLNNQYNICCSFHF